MKQIISNIVLAILSLTLFFFLYVRIFKATAIAVAVLLFVLVLYGFCMGLGWKSSSELKKYEQKLIHHGLNDKDKSTVLLYSCLTLLPGYFCVLLVSMVPLFKVEVWFVTVFPCILLSLFPIRTVLDEYNDLTNKKLPFILSVALQTVISCLLGVIVSFLLMNNLPS